MAPPKPKADAASTGPLIDLFKSLGLPQPKATEAAKNPKSAEILRELIEVPGYNLSGKTLDEKPAVLIAAFAGLLAKNDLGTCEREYVCDAIVDGRLKSVDQVTGTSHGIGCHPDTK